MFEFKNQSLSSLYINTFFLFFFFEGDKISHFFKICLVFEISQLVFSLNFLANYFFPTLIEFNFSLKHKINLIFTENKLKFVDKFLQTIPSPDVEKNQLLIIPKPFKNHSLQKQNIQKRPQVNKLKNFSILIIP